MTARSGTTSRLRLTRDICRARTATEPREWLVTNGIGGFASGTVDGTLTRRYHGLLIAALEPPVGRTLLVAKLDETAHLGTDSFQLYANAWKGGVLDPPANSRLERFELVLGVPTWHFRLGRCPLTKRIWMEPGQNVAYVRYDLAQRSRELTLDGRVLVNYRDYHALTRAGDWHMRVEQVSDGLRVHAFDGAVPFKVRCLITGASATGWGAEWTTEHLWYRDFYLAAERDRGFDHLEDHLCAGTWRVVLRPGQAATLVLAAESDPNAALDCTHAARALSRRDQHAETLLRAWERSRPPTRVRPPQDLAQLVLAADQFVVERRGGGERGGHTIIAGYHWFSDWGRDTMIALPGLTLVTGRAELAREILRTWAQYVDRGMIPNRFPDAGEEPDYNSVDASLWYLWAIDQYVRATNDLATLSELFPVMTEIVDWYRRGTRHNIHLDVDGLLYAGEPGVNLTWMDAKIGERVITPRIGKPVELSALWYDGLRNLARLAEMLGRSGAQFERLAERARASFGRFWNPPRNCCFDVLDGPTVHDPALRPNQIFAVSLEHSPLTDEQQRSLLTVCQNKLLVPYGLRSLASDEPGYRGRYAGGPVERDEAYHQGTAWGWLLGPFVLAHYRVRRDAKAARDFLRPMLQQALAHGLGTLSEVFDAEPPHRPNGCIAQAWSVAETLRAWHVTQGASRSWRSPH